MGARVTTEVEERILEMYQHRINLILEAEEYTIKKIAERLGVGTTTVWSKTHGLDMVRREDTYVQRMEDELEKIKRSLALAQERAAKIMHVFRKAVASANQKHQAASRIFSSAESEVSEIITGINKVLNK
jgi:hypothetical protein